MRVLLVHNYYKQRGGEDLSFDSEARMLRESGHEVRLYTRHNDEIDSMSRSRVALDSFWNRRTNQEVRAILKEFPADVVHCTNLFPLISTSVYDAARSRNVPVVQSLRNYRQMCLNSLFFRSGRICEKCGTQRFALSGILNKCYRNNRVGSAVVAANNSFQRLRGTWKNRIERYFTPTRFTRQKFIEFGFPGERIAVKPNFLFDDCGPGNEEREFGLFVGRLSPEKGLTTLLDVWSEMAPGIPLRIVGGGLLNGAARRSAEADPMISYEGELPHDQVTQMIGNAKFLIMPSEWYETFGRTLMESFSRGTPVIASRIGAMAELVESGQTGLTFEPGNKSELAHRIRYMLDNEHERRSMGRVARQAFEDRYTVEANLKMLMQIYADAINGTSMSNE
ncbi:MAG: glycosyltransferase [Planctomycetota bacterium]